MKSDVSLKDKGFLPFPQSLHIPQGESLSVLTKAGTESFVSEGVDRFCRHKNCQMSFSQLCTTYILCFTIFIEQILVVCSYKNPPQSDLVWQAIPHSIIPDLGPSAAAMVTSSVLLEEKRFQTFRGKFIFRQLCVLIELIELEEGLANDVTVRQQKSLLIIRMTENIVKCNFGPLYRSSKEPNKII